MTDSEREIPKQLQPDPRKYSFDLVTALNSVVSLQSFVPRDALTANTLGMERSGSGVVIRESGLIVTIGYLITEAETIWINTNDGRAVAGHALAFDQETGFGLVQALGKLDLPALEIGDSDQLQIGDRCILAAGGGIRHALENKLVARQEFAGYWEYALDEAFYTATPHPFWGGTGLIGKNGRLLGIGSLIIQQNGDAGSQSDMNMVVPIDLLHPILSDILNHGRVNRSARPWLGMYAVENEEDILVGGLADRGPAERAGVQIGDSIIAVEGEEVTDIGELWRRVWSSGQAGAPVRLSLARDGTVFEITIASADRASFLKTPKLH